MAKTVATKPWAAGAREVAKELGSDAHAGLRSAEAAKRLSRFGSNRLAEEKEIRFIDVFKEEIQEPMILLLLGVAVIYSIWGSLTDAVTILVVIIALVVAEVLNESRAKRSIARLRKLSEPSAGVMRDGAYREVPTADLVPGDVLVLKVGQRIPADARLISSFGLQVDESALTGESVTSEKDAESLALEKTPLADRLDMVYAGTIITRGKGTAVVVATGTSTELGRISKLAGEIKIRRTPLQLAMRQLSGWIVWVAIFFSVLIPAIGLLQGRDLHTMILTGLSLSFATIPEELPIIITMVLGVGALALSGRHALVKRLNAAETLGSVTTIVTDKTGTLTENRMRLDALFSDGKQTVFGDRVGATQRKVLEIGALVNDAVEKQGARGEYSGDPVEIALLRAASRVRIDTDALRRRYALRSEFSFDNERKMMSQVYGLYGKTYVFAKGAPESVIAASSHAYVGGSAKGMDARERRALLEGAGKMASRGMRVLAFAYKEAQQREPTQKQAESNLVFVGLAGFVDPARKDVRGAIAACRRAGVRVIMVTGDHELTAKAVAQEIGIDASAVVSGSELDGMSDARLRSVVKAASVFARTTPKHKFRIVGALKANGETVAVTGDGINDAPALKRADIGVAMGETGTDVARETADMILTDDNFSTIAVAVREGRKIFDNLRKGVRYYLACKIALVLIFLLPILLDIPLPFAPIQIILLELFMDLAASAAYVSEPAEAGIMERKPRDPKEHFMDLAMQRSIYSGAASLFLAVSMVYVVSFYNGLAEARTMAFATWMIGHVMLAVNMRSDKETVTRLGFASNRVMVWWAAGAMLLLVSVVNVPALQMALKTSALSAQDWLTVLGVAFVATFWMEAVKTARHGR